MPTLIYYSENTLVRDICEVSSRKFSYTFFKDIFGELQVMESSPWVLVSLYDAKYVNVLKVLDRLAYWPIVGLISVEHSQRFCSIFSRNP